MNLTEIIAISMMSDLSDEIRHRCKICGKEFKTGSGCDRHISSKHVSEVKDMMNKIIRDSIDN